MACLCDRLVRNAVSRESRCRDMRAVLPRLVGAILEPCAAAKCPYRAVQSVHTNARAREARVVYIRPGVFHCRDRLAIPGCLSDPHRSAHPQRARARDVHLEGFPWEGGRLALQRFCLSMAVEGGTPWLLGSQSVHRRTPQRAREIWVRGRPTDIRPWDRGICNRPPAEPACRRTCALLS